MPSRMRAKKMPAKPLENAVMTEATPHRKAPQRPTRVGPKRSITIPTGICSSEYDQAKAENSRPSSTGVSWNMSLICGAATDRPMRSM